MDSRPFEEKIYYSNIIEIIKIIIMITAMLLYWNLYIKINTNFKYFLDLIRLIINMVILMLIVHIKSIRKKRLYIVLEFFSIISLIIMIMFIVLERDSFDLININNNFRYSSLNLLLIYYIISKFKNINSKKIYIEYSIGFIITIFLTYIQVMDSGILSNILYAIVTIIYIKKIYIEIRSNKICIKSKVNLFIISYIFTSLMVFIYIIEIYFKSDNFLKIAIQIHNILIFSIIICAIENLIKENYTYVFKETYEENKRLDELNKKLNIRTKELEEYHEILIEIKNIYKHLLNNIQKPIVILNKNNLRINYCNNDFLLLIEEKKLRNVINRKFDRFINIENKNQNKSNNNLYIGQIKSNTTKILELEFMSVNESTSDLVVIIKDITEKTRLESMERELETKRINDEIKRGFLSTISHDLKVPINVIYSSSQLAKILIKNNDIKSLYKYNSICKENCTTLTKFTNNLIDISKISGESIKPILVCENIVTFIEDNVNSLDYYAKSKKIELLFDTDIEEIFIKFDKDMMKRILINLISNAVKFTEEYGSIKVYIKDFESKINIEISDTGIGISKEFIRQAFDKYSKDSSINKIKSNGTGIGLFVVYNLVELQGGNVTIESEIGKGSTFTIELFKEQVNGG